MIVTSQSQHAFLLLHVRQQGHQENYFQYTGNTYVQSLPHGPHPCLSVTLPHFPNSLKIDNFSIHTHPLVCFVDS